MKRLDKHYFYKEALCKVQNILYLVKIYHTVTNAMQCLRVLLLLLLFFKIALYEVVSSPAVVVVVYLRLHCMKLSLLQLLLLLFI